jgi:hypothetical protein
MTLKFAAAIALLVATPALAQQGAPAGAPPAGPKPSKAEVQKLVDGIKADKAKSDQYCNMMKLYDEAAQAEEKKDQKKVDDLTKQADEVGKKLGQDYEKVMTGLQNVDPSTPEGQELSTILDSLDSTCPGANAAGAAPKK